MNLQDLCHIISKYSYSACDALGMTLDESEGNQLIKEIKELILSELDTD